MSTVVKKTINLKIDGKDVTAPEGTVILEAAKKNGFEVNGDLRKAVLDGVQRQRDQKRFRPGY